MLKHFLAWKSIKIRSCSFLFIGCNQHFSCQLQSRSTPIAYIYPPFLVNAKGVMLHCPRSQTTVSEEQKRELYKRHPPKKGVKTAIHLKGSKTVWQNATPNKASKTYTVWTWRNLWLFVASLQIPDVISINYIRNGVAYIYKAITLVTLFRFMAFRLN